MSKPLSRPEMYRTLLGVRAAYHHPLTIFFCAFLALFPVAPAGSDYAYRTV